MDTNTSKAIARLSICTAACLGTTALSALLPEAIAVLGGGALGAILEATKSVLPGNVANALDAATQGKEPDRLSLANEDLARAAGRAIAQIIRDVAKDQYNGRTRGDLEKIANGAVENWVEIARRETSQERYRELMERNLDELLTAEGESFAKETAMTAEAWGDVFALLNMAAHKKSQFQLDAAVGETIAQQLHTNFPKALREALKDDFQKDGKAFAGLTLSLLTNIQEQVKQQGERSTVNFEEILKQLEEIKIGLQPAAEPLTRQRWRELCGEMLEQQQLRTNVFTNNRGVSPIIKDVYVPLALVERREKRQVKPNSPEAESPEGKEREEQLVPTSEDEFLEEVLRRGQSKSQGKRIAVVGEPGSGKTTRLQFIANWILEKHLGLPVWVSLRDLGDKNISSFLEEKWKYPLPGVKVEFEQLTAQAKDIWLLLDGVDEMTARIESRHVEKLLAGWVVDARVIVTCRTNVWEADRNAFSGFDVFRNLEFAPAQVEDYIRKWFGGMEKPSVGEELLAQLGQSPNQRLRDLIGNPLRLWMLCQIWHPEVGLPETQAELYGEFVDWVYCWKVEEEIADRREEINSALAGLALAAMQETEGSDRLRLQEKWVRKQLKERWIFKAVEGLWLNLVSREGREAVYAFNHLTFLEYFAALAVPGWRFFFNHVPGNPGQGVYRIFAPEWKQVILLWLGRNDVEPQEKEEFVRALVEFEDGCGEWNLLDVDRGFYEYRAYFLAAAGINELRDFSLAEEIVEKVMRWGWGFAYFDETFDETVEWLTYLDSIQKSAREVLKETIRDRAITVLENILANITDDGIRWQVIDSLGEIAPGNEKAIAVLVELLATTDDGTFWRAAWSLGQIAPGNKKAIAALEKLLGDTTDENTCRQAAESLGKIAPGNEKAIAALVKLVATTTDELTRKQAVECLRIQGKENAETALEELLADTTDEETRLRAAWSLGQIAPGNKKAIAALEKLLGDTTDELTRGQAAYRLGQIAPGNEKAIAALVNLLKNLTNEYNRRQIAKCLIQIAPGNTKAIAALVPLLANTTDESVLEQAVKCLGQIAPGNEKAIAALVKLVPSSTDEIRGHIVECLGNITPLGHKRAIEVLEELLPTTANEDTRRLAANNLGKIAPGNQKAMEALVELLISAANQSTRRLAANNLGKIAPGNQKAMEVLERRLPMLTTSDEKTCMLAAWTLGKIAPGNEKAIEVLVNLLRNTTDPLTRSGAARCLGQIAPPGHEKAINAIVNMLTTTNYLIPVWGVPESLAKIAPPGHEGAINALVKLLKTSTNNDTSWRAADSLEKIASGNERATTALVELLETTTNENTLWRAAYTLEKILKTNKQYSQVAFKLKHHLNPEVRRFNPYLYDESYYLIWQCAQNLPYPEFYRAWHGHNPDHANQTPQTFDPQQLNRALQQRQLGDTVQPYYIDGSQFVNRDNPAPEIYHEMLDQNSPQRSQGEPANMQEFKLYWKQQCRQGKPILILYEDPQPPAPQGFSETFLQALSRCGGSICLVWEGETPSGLPTFSPADPHLIEKLVDWSIDN